MVESGAKLIQQFAYAGHGAARPPISFTERRSPRWSGWPGVVKRVSDVIIAMVALIVLAVPLLIIGLLIRWDSPGPALFRQRRIGLDGEAFVMWKFRTMYCDPRQGDELRQACRGDPRVTRVGGWLRTRSFDEFPQLLNVLSGEMAMVGPRPHAPGTCAAGRPFEQISPRYAARHRMPPGITGLAQVRGWRGETDTEYKLLGRVDSDLEYIATWSLWLDLVILLRTLSVLRCSRDAY